MNKGLKMHELFNTFGEETKAKAPEFCVYYDFKPHDSEEPLLFALGVYSLDI